MLFFAIAPQVGGPPWCGWENGQDEDNQAQAVDVAT